MCGRCVVLAVAVAAASCAEQRPRLPAAAEGRTAEEALAGACASCHIQQSAEWSASLHRASYTERDFQVSFRSEPLDFCFGCHAPLARDRTDDRGAARGVGCPSCHQVPAGHGRQGIVARATTSSCAGCHEFAFPGSIALMQKTATEHAESNARSVSCASCHFARGSDGHVDHRAHVSRNEELLRASLALDAARDEAGLRVTLTPRGVGHALPTGGLFRRIRLVVTAEDFGGSPMGEREVLLARRFDRRSGRPREIEDSRLTGPRTVRIGDEWVRDAARVVVEVHYERVAQTMDTSSASGDPSRYDAVFARVRLHRVELGAARR